MHAKCFQINILLKFARMIKNNVSNRQATKQHQLLRYAGGGGVLPYISYIGMCGPQRVWFLSCFGLKTDIDFDHYGLKSGMVFKGTTRAY